MLVKEYEVKVSKDKEENKVLYNSQSLEEKFLKLYNHIKEYEKENKLLIMVLKDILKILNFMIPLFHLMIQIHLLIMIHIIQNLVKSKLLMTILQNLIP